MEGGLRVHDGPLEIQNGNRRNGLSLFRTPFPLTSCEGNKRRSIQNVFERIVVWLLEVGASVCSNSNQRRTVMLYVKVHNSQEMIDPASLTYVAFQRLAGLRGKVGFHKRIRRSSCGQQERIDSFSKLAKSRKIKVAHVVRGRFQEQLIKTPRVLQSVRPARLATARNESGEGFQTPERSGVFSAIQTGSFQQEC
jgi:hypothetical protein